MSLSVSLPFINLISGNHDKPLAQPKMRFPSPAVKPYSYTPSLPLNRKKSSVEFLLSIPLITILLSTDITIHIPNSDFETQVTSNYFD